jgi:SAM-dependent methyltransferase
MISTFRDPGGFVFTSAGRILRYVHPHAAEGFRELLDSDFFHSAEADGKLVTSRTIEAAANEFGIAIEDGSVVAEHRAVPFVNYPFEWTAEMLHAAGELTLQLAGGALEAGFEMKDATPFNVIFDGPTPVFVDMLSFEKLRQPEALWRAYAQFVRTFVYPLIAFRSSGWAINEVFANHRDGLETERMMRILPGWRLGVPPALNEVALPYLISKLFNLSYARRPARDRAEAVKMQRGQLRHAQKVLDRCKPLTPERPGGPYEAFDESYSADAYSRKLSIVKAGLTAYRPRHVLDVGCNSGDFSLLTAENGADVVAIDSDSNAVGRLWRRAAAAEAKVLPLVVNLASPSPATGWANNETISFLARARGRFDCVLMLALAHHLLVTERIPLARILDLAAKLTRELLIIEYVDPQDTQFKKIARGRDDLHRDFNRESFERQAGVNFQILGSDEVTSTRCIYLLRKKEV